MLNKDKIDAINALTNNDGWIFMKEFILAKIKEISLAPYPSTRPEDIAVEALSRQKSEKMVMEMFNHFEMIKAQEKPSNNIDRMV
jgi:hypothetical protein